MCTYNMYVYACNVSALNPETLEAAQEPRDAYFTVRCTVYCKAVATALHIIPRVETTKFPTSGGGVGRPRSAGGVLGHHGVPGRKWCPRTKVVS